MESIEVEMSLREQVIQLAGLDVDDFEVVLEQAEEKAPSEVHFAGELTLRIGLGNEHLHLGHGEAHMVQPGAILAEHVKPPALVLLLEIDERVGSYCVVFLPFGHGFFWLKPRTARHHDVLLADGPAYVIA